MSQALVLSIGFDLAVLNARNLVLESAGYIVVPAMSAEQALQVLLDGDFDLVILCHSLPIEVCELLTRFIRTSGLRIPIARVLGELCQSASFAATLERTPIEFLAGIRDLMAEENHMSSITNYQPRHQPNDFRDGDSEVQI